MSRRLARLAAVGAVAATIGALGALPAAAVGPFGPPEVLVPSCGPGLGDAAISATGTVRGFAECGDTTRPIWYFEDGAVGTAYSELTPYSGVVLAVAWDGVNATYVVYESAGGLRLGKRLTSGAYSPPTTLTTVGANAVFYSADVVASAGKWWAVWSEQVGPGGEFAQRELFQRHTLLGTQGRTRITTTAGNIDDAEPTLGYASGRVTMVWTRRTNPAVPGPSDLRIASSTGGAWSSRPLASLGDQNDFADLLVYAGVTYVAWTRDGQIVVASNAGGTFASRTFSTPGSFPFVGVSGDRLFVTWATETSQVFVAERAAGVWTGAAVTGAPGAPLAIPAQGGKARLVYRSASDIRIRTQT